MDTGKQKIEKFVADFISQLEQMQKEGVKVEWTRGFTPLLQHFFNPVTKNGYNGGNILVAWVYMLIFGYSDSRFITLNNAKKLAGEFGIDLSKIYILPKEKFEKEKVPMFHFKWIEKELEERDENGEKKKVRFPFINSFDVFCIESFIPEFREKFNEKYPLPIIDETIPQDFEEMVKWGTENVGVSIAFNAFTQTAYYDILNHKITMPFPKQYFEEQRAKKTFFHELAHSTGRKLQRNMNGNRNTPEYAKEEIIAEMTAAIVMDILGYGIPEESFDYILGYLRNNKPQTIWGILAKVAAAVDLILGKAAEAEPEAEAAE